MKNKILLLSISSLFLFGCNVFNPSYIRYGVTKPFIKLESSEQEKGVLKEITPTEIVRKMNQKNTFMLYIHANYCGHCQESEKDFLNPYLEEHLIVVYGIDLGNYTNPKDDERILFNEQVRPIIETRGYYGTPYYALFENGDLLMGEQDSSYFSLFFNAYIITE